MYATLILPRSNISDNCISHDPNTLLLKADFTSHNKTKIKFYSRWIIDPQ